MLKEILIISNFDSIKDTFKSNFSVKYNVSFYEDERKAIEYNEKSFFDYIFIDLNYLKNFKNTPLTVALFNESYIPLLKHFPEAKKIIMADRRFLQDCVLAVRNGIDSYINYPLVNDEIQYVMDLILERTNADAVIKHIEQNNDKSSLESFFESKSEVMKSIVKNIKSVAPTDSTVLITGDSGVGKSVLARRIHNLSRRKNKNFISVHCGALTENLIESELFGHEKGAFTGAIRRKLGKFELANGGTIFLDEIGTLSEATQIRLLQVIQERFIQRVGGEADIKVNIRIIAATNSHLVDLIQKNIFREDLYYRLNVFQIKMPSLSERSEDIEDLSNRIINSLNKIYKKNIDGLCPNVLLAFLRYDWPGNIRELENLIERSYILEKSLLLTQEHFPEKIFKGLTIPKPDLTSASSKLLSLSTARKETLNIFEKDYIQKLLKNSNGDLQEAAVISGVGIRQLHKFIAKHQVNRQDFIISLSMFTLQFLQLNAIYV